MAEADLRRTERILVAERDGYFCFYCRVPTAATIEHVEARNNGGSYHAENLVIACPRCNSTKGDRTVEEFLASGGQRLQVPEELPKTVHEMVLICFGSNVKEGFVMTGTPNSRLQIKDEQAIAWVRAGRGDEWRLFVLGPVDSAKVAAASWDFLTRHHTPPKPRKPRPPKQAFKNRPRGRSR